MGSLLHQNLSECARANPDREAFRCAGHSLTYGELNHKSSQLASLLIAEGVEPGDRVAIRLPLSLESAIAVYGILKSGAVFVPLDPLTPAKRLSASLKAGDISCLVTDRLTEPFLESLEQEAPSLRVVIGASVRAPTTFRLVPWDTYESHEPAKSIPIQEESPAYVIFTSGSTGLPKGIIHTHASGNSYARLSTETYGVTNLDRIANISPLHFDMSTFGFLSSVFAGATTVLIPAAYGKLPASLAGMMEEEKISIWYSVPFTLIQLLERGLIEKRNLSTLRWVKFGGEPFSPIHLRKLQESWPKAQFSNIYGPAEVNQCTYHHVPQLKKTDTEAIPLGTIWNETEALVVDEKDQPVKSDSEGELLIHSTTMMARYWNGKANDPQTFYINNDGKRFYRTGDMVSHNQQGELTFLGRRDRQVKIRGYRIELDEIEHVAAAHETVEEAAAFCMRCDEVNEAALAVTSRDGATIDEAALRKHLKSRLPSYAFPNRIFIRKEMPRTTSGKINRNALQKSRELFKNSENPSSPPV